MLKVIIQQYFSWSSEVIERREVQPEAPEASTPDLPCSKKFYKRLFLETTKLSNFAMVSSFLVGETKSRKADRKSAITKKLDQASWRELREVVKKRLEAEQTSPSNQEKIVLKNLRQIITCWILFPNLKGEKPSNWNQVVQLLSESWTRHVSINVYFEIYLKVSWSLGSATGS